MNKIYLFLLTLFAAVGIANAADVQIWGAVTNGQKVNMNPTSDANVYEYTATFSGSETNWFKVFHSDGEQYGAASRDAKEFGTTVSLTKNGYQDIIYKLPAPGDYTIVFNLEALTVTIRKAGESGGGNTGDNKDVPANLYFIGTGYGYNGGDFKPMDKNGSTFSTTVTFNETENTFRFNLVNNNSKWNDENNYGISSDDNYTKNAEQGADKKNGISKGLKGNYKIGAGTYNVTVYFTDPANPYFTISKHVEVAAGHPHIYFADSDYNVAYAMDKVDDNTYTYSYSPVETRNFIFAFHEGKADGALDLTGRDQYTFGGSADTAGGSWTVDADAKALVVNACGPVQAYLTKGTNYTLTLKRNANGWTLAITTPQVYDVDIEHGRNIEKGDERYYYLSGDINVWSDTAGRNTKNSVSNNYGSTAGSFEHENTGAFNYKQDDQDNPYLHFESIQDMNRKWRFDYVGKSPFGHSGDHWYKLDLKAKGAGDREGHIGRLCGEFKIIAGKVESTGEGYGVGGDNSDTYYGKTIQPGVLFTHGGLNGGQNFLLSNTVIENAVVYFERESGDVYITGQGKDLFVYYAKVQKGANTFGQPSKTYLNDPLQQNKYVPKDHYRNGTAVTQGTKDDFSWHKYTLTEALADGKEGLFYRNDPSTGLSFDYVYRKKIPSSFAHAAPMGYLTSVTKSNGKWFPRVRFSCEDVWFLENEVYVYVRYLNEEMNQNAKVYYNAFADRYDSNLVLMDKPYYMKDKMIPMTVDGEENIVKIESGEHYGTWHKSPETLDDYFTSNAYAIVATNYGAYLPYGDSKASLDDKARVKVDGQDVYITLDAADPDLNILYDYLNGTFKKGAATTIQINAEYFVSNPDAYNVNDIDFSYGDGIEYEFTVERNGAHVAKQERGKDPFYNWNVEDCVPGLYNVRVKVYDGKNVNTANDVYIIYPAN